MKKIRIIAVLVLLFSALIPNVVNAGGTFYCSTSVTTDGTGTLGAPWACSDDTQLQSVIDDKVCDIYSGGVLYQIFPDSYRYHVITYYSSADCRVTSTFDYAGFPPSTGVDVPTPYIVGGVALLGAGLVAAGIILRRRQTALG